MTLQEIKIRRLLYGVIFAVCFFYVGQILIYKYRFFAISANLVETQLISENCDDKNCRAQFSLSPTGKYLLLGHIMRFHKIIDSTNMKEVYPISAVRGVASESWIGLRVYPVEPGKTYQLEATKPKAVKMGYFVGILPRSTDHEGVLSIPDISPTISTITSMASFGLLGLLLFAAYLAPSTGSTARSSRDELLTVTLCSVAGGISGAISSGLFDSLLPDGELRSRILRTFFAYSTLALPLVSRLSRFTKKRNLLNALVFVTVVLTINIFWGFFRAGAGWISASFASIMLLSLYYFSQRKVIAGLLAAFCIRDIAYFSGIISNTDIPPIYFMQVLLISSFSVLVLDMRSALVLSLAARSYQRFTRDLVLAKLSDQLLEISNRSKGEVSLGFGEVLPDVAQLTGAGSVSILLNFPFSRPITHVFSRATNKVATHDDGRIPGAVTFRALVYGDEAVLEPYNEFITRVGLTKDVGSPDSRFVSIVPIKINGNAVGVLMLSNYDDALISQWRDNGTIDEVRETTQALVGAITAVFSRILLSDLRATTALSVKLLSQIREFIPKSSSSDDFMVRYCHAVSQATGMMVVLHQRSDLTGIAVAQCGLPKASWVSFLDSPFNLRPEVSSFGGTVVAFKEAKASYVKDWSEVQEKLHPKTVQLLEHAGVRSILAVPLTCGNSQFVLTLLSPQSEPPKDPGVMKVIEATEAIFDAAITVLDQKTSVLALGKLATRLIGDDDIREKIVSAAKEDTLPTTIGSARTSFLLLFDLVGSSDLPSEAEEKAKSYGKFYDEVNRAVGRFLGGKIRKTIGDAVIATWDGTPIKLEAMNDLLPRLHEVAKVADATARVVGCKGVRLVLHYGDYFFGLVGTSSFGQIDVIGRGIDEVCKMESYMKTLKPQGQVLKMVITDSAAVKLRQIPEAQYRNFAYSSGLNESNAHGAVIAWFHGGEILALKTHADLAEVPLMVPDQAS